MRVQRKGLQCKNVNGYQQYAWGVAPNNVADRIAWAVNYELPFGKSMTGIEGGFIKGWSTNALWFVADGPRGFTTSPGSTPPDGIASAGYSIRFARGKEKSNPRLFPPQLVQKLQLLRTANTPANGTLGNERFGTLFGPHQKRLDFSLSKEFPIKENIKLQFRTEVFNLLNQTNLGQPNASIAYASATPALPNGNFTNTPLISAPGSSHISGEITGMNANWNQREIQFALKLLF